MHRQNQLRPRQDPFSNFALDGRYSTRRSWYGPEQIPARFRSKERAATKFPPSCYMTARELIFELVRGGRAKLNTMRLRLWKCYCCYY